MKYRERMKLKDARWKERQHRALIGSRMKALVMDTGLGIDGAAKMLHVTGRTVRYWISGHTQVPYSAYKLLRVLRFMELPGYGWEGWSMHSGKLWTPEGRSIAATDSSWWSHMVNKSQLFHTLYNENVKLRLELAAIRAAQGLADGTRSAAANAGPPKSANEAQGVLTSLHGQRVQCSGYGFAPSPVLPVGNTGITTELWGQYGAIMEPWPSISDSLLPLNPTQESGANGSESASIPSSVSPWTPICEGLQPQIPALPEKLRHLRHSRQSQNQRLPKPCQSPPAVLKSSPHCEPPSPSSLLSPCPQFDPLGHRSPSSAPSQARPIEGGLQTGTATTPRVEAHTVPGGAV